ncbi:hypothetical protein SDC9_174448 [bioreactor metagenome]|uniref:Uncharacterized protein n=1 Tax=bioreactor metagenome TaxID=1076179 RepID=A0A645GJ74_9ZZZZ
MQLLDFGQFLRDNKRIICLGEELVQNEAIV